MISLYEFQSTAVQNVVSEFIKADRAKVIMPCGTGKTIVGVHVVKKMTPKRSLIMAPSLALVKQLLDTHAEQSELSRVMVVCSDDSTAKEAREKFDIPGVTTDVQVIAAELRKRSGITVFSTYQSSPKIAEAFASAKLPAFDLAIFDEAHHMAGGSKIFTTPLDDDRIRIRKRLFMTATPRIATQSAKEQADDEGYEFASMDDESQFGREAFGMSFNEAIEGEYLTDYQVAVFVVKESEIQQWVNDDEDANATAKRVALVRAMQEHDIRKVIAYHSTIGQMNWFADTGLRDTFDAFKKSKQVTGSLWSGALEGADPVSVRRRTLNHFASLNGDSRAVLNNCRVLQEGIDCPAVDAVCLIEPRTQPVDIVQIVGRAIRKSPKKKIATIILPVFMPKGVEEDVEEFVKSSDFATVWDVIAAIKSHDNRVHGWVSSAGSFSGSASKSHIKFNINLPSVIQGKFYEAIESRIVTRFSDVTLTEDLIWGWMQDHYRENGKWPSVNTPGRWSVLDNRLRKGRFGLPGGSSLAKLRGNLGSEQPLTEAQIYECIQDYYSKTGRWPAASTICPASPYGSWPAIDMALRLGRRGLPGGSSIAKLRGGVLTRAGSLTKRGASNQLTFDQIYEWMLDHKMSHGVFPNCEMKTKVGDTNWRAIDSALRLGSRGLPGGSSIAKFRKKMFTEN